MKSTELTIYNYEEHDAHDAIDAHHSIDAHDADSAAISDCINYAESQIEKYSPLIESALSKRHVRLFQKSMRQFMTNDEINALGQNSWKSVFDIYIKAFCWAAVSNQYTYSTPAFRKNLTYKVILKKCLILDLSYDDTLKVMKECGFLDGRLDDEERQQNTAGSRSYLSDPQSYAQLKDIYYQITHQNEIRKMHLDTLKALCTPEQYEDIVETISEYSVIPLVGTVS